MSFNKCIVQCPSCSHTAVVREFRLGSGECKKCGNIIRENDVVDTFAVVEHLYGISRSECTHSEDEVLSILTKAIKNNWNDERVARKLK